MRRNCPNCGERFEGDVCPVCRTSVKVKKKAESAADKFLTAEQKADAELRAGNRKKSAAMLWALIIIVVAGAVFIFYRNGLLGGGSYKKTIEQYFNSICSRDFAGYIGTMPYAMGQDYAAEREELGYSEYDYLDKLYSDLFTQFGEDMTIDLTFLKHSRPDEAIIKTFEDDYLRAYGEPIELSAVYGVEVNAVFSGETSTAEVPLVCFVVRQRGKWYMVGCDFIYEEAAE